MEIADLNWNAAAGSAGAAAALAISSFAATWNNKTLAIRTFDCHTRSRGIASAGGVEPNVDSQRSGISET